MIRYEVLESAEEKSAWQKSAMEFFAHVFQRPLSADDYQHFMVRSPYEAGRFIIALDGDRVVGTANLISQRLTLQEEAIPYYLFTTSAVDPEYRRKGVYLGLMRLVTEASKSAGKRFILAFPNEMALLPLTKLCGFRLIRSLSFVRRPVSELGALRAIERGSSIALDPDFLAWRFEHRAYFAVRRGDQTLICKRYGDATDVVEVLEEAPSTLSAFVSEGELSGGEVNLLGTRCTTSLSGEPGLTLNATWRPLRDGVEAAAIDLSLLMWDIV